MFSVNGSAGRVKTFAVLLYLGLFILGAVSLHYYYWNKPRHIVEWVLGVGLPDSAVDVSIEWKTIPDSAVVVMRSVMAIPEADALEFAKKLKLGALLDAPLCDSSTGSSISAHAPEWWKSAWNRQKSAKVSYSWMKGNGNMAPNSIAITWADGEMSVYFDGIHGTAAL